ncbi:MAG: hypothetical protein R8K21_05455 [Mariprofundales bacterium]
MNKKTKYAKSIITLAIACVFATTAAISTANADEMFSAKLGFYNMTASGLLAGSLNTVAGPLPTKIDVSNDLNLDNSGQIGGEVAINLGDSRLSLEYVPMDFSGTGVISQPITFNNATFTVNSTIETQLKMDMFDIGYTYYLVNMDDVPTRVQFGIDVALKVVNVDASLTELTTNKMEAVSTTVPIPTMGVRGRIALADFLGVIGRVGYLGYGNNSFLDTDIQVEFSPLPMMGVYAGYRYMSLKIDITDIFADLRFSGPYAGLFARF